MERLGRYLLVEPMAAGGMAEVFRAVCLGGSGVARPVAVKRILPHLTRDPTVVAMLVEEARIALSLNHRNVVRVVDLGQEEGSYFIVMELIEGQPLSALMTRARSAASASRCNWDSTWCRNCWRRCATCTGSRMKRDNRSTSSTGTSVRRTSW